MRYVAFLRGINVGGHRIVRMEALRGWMTDLGFKSVQSYIQSGNVVFSRIDPADSNLSAQRSGKQPADIADAIEAMLAEKLGYPVVTCIRAWKELLPVIRKTCFVNLQATDKPYVSFLRRMPLEPMKLADSPRGDWKIVAVDGLEVYVVMYRVGGFPYPDIESMCGVPVTTRNWYTLGKMMAAFAAPQ